MGVWSGSRRGVWGPRAEIVAVEVADKQLGSLPVVADFCRRMDIGGIIDRACPIRDLAYVTHGQVIEVLIANRLTQPTAMVRVADWARTWAVAEVFGVPADVLDDDRLGRALDAIAEQSEQIVGSVGAAAIEAFGIDVTRLHWDMTSISLYGSYEDSDPAFPAPGYGHPKDRRSDLLQIQAGIAVCGDGGIPIWHRAFDGAAGEVAQVVDTMGHLKTLAGPRGFLLVGDSKLISYGNVTAMINGAVTFIAPLAAARVPTGLFAGLDRAAAEAVDYIADRDQDKPSGQRCRYRVTEDVMAMRGPRKCDPVHQLRRVLVHSSANQQAAIKARRRQLAGARVELDTLVRTAGTRHHPDITTVAAKAAEITRRRRITGYLHTTITTGADGKPAFAWVFDQTAIDAETATDGWYALLTNLPPDIDAAAVFERYKGQPAVERRYSTIKGPLAVTPMFLHNNRRITALITVICLALLIFCLIERDVRNRLAPDTEIRGFYTYDGRSMPPTGRLILQALDELRMTPAHHGHPPHIPQPGPLQAKLLALLNVDPTQPRGS